MASFINCCHILLELLEKKTEFQINDLVTLPNRYNMFIIKDLGVIMDSSLTFETHIQQKIGKANSMVGLIRRTFTHLDEEIFLYLYKTLVRPHLEYANCVWNPSKLKLIDALENVQRRATKLVPTLKNLSYEDRLKKLKLSISLILPFTFSTPIW